MSPGQWWVGSDGVRWHFDAGARCLDFGYTGDFGYGHVPWERLREPGDLTAWLREHLAEDLAPARERDLAEALRLRAAVVAVARALAEGAAVPGEAASVIDSFAAQADIAPQLGTGPHQGWEVSHALSTIARDAVAVFAEGPGRIRACTAGDCFLIFRDTSRPGSRRWCSMQRCGNRTKMRGRNARIRA